MAGCMQRIMSFWLGALVASLVLTAMAPGVLSWGPDGRTGEGEEDAPDQEGPEEGPDRQRGEDGQDQEGGEDGPEGADERGAGPVGPANGKESLRQAAGGASGSGDTVQHKLGAQEEEEEQGLEDGGSGTMGRMDPAGDEPPEGEDGKDDQTDEGGKEPREGDGGDEGADEGADEAGTSRPGSIDVVDDRSLPCLQVASRARCGGSNDPGLRGLPGLLLPKEDEPVQDGAGHGGGQDVSMVEPFSRSRAVTPENGPDLLAWGAGVGLFAVVIGVLVRLFGVYYLGRGFLPAGWRLDRDRVVNHPVRRDILDHLKKRPGATVQELADEAGVANSRAAYHLSVLKREECVSERVVDGRRHFFLHAAPVVEPDRLRKRAIGRAGRSPGRVLAFLRQSPGATVSHVARSLGFSPGHAHYHLTRLAKEGLLDRVRRGRRVRHYLTSEGHELVAQPQEPAAASSVCSTRTDEVAA